MILMKPISLHMGQMSENQTQLRPQCQFNNLDPIERGMTNGSCPIKHEEQYIRIQMTEGCVKDESV